MPQIHDLQLQATKIRMLVHAQAVGEIDAAALI